MKRPVFLTLLILALVGLEEVHAQWDGPDVPESISVQGLLTDTTGAAVPDGNYNLLFKLYKGGMAVWQQNQIGVPVTGGLFNVTLDGSGGALLDTVAFNVPIDMGVTVNGGAELTPRTPLTSASYALAVRGLHAVDADDGESVSPNLIGGASNNSVAAGVVGATISGGGGTTEGSPLPNHVDGKWGTIGGGKDNSAGQYGTVAGGISNEASGFASVANGYFNAAIGIMSTVAGGGQNEATGDYSIVPGGWQNRARGDYSFAGGGFAKANHDRSFVWNGFDPLNLDSLWSTAPQQFIIGAPGGVGINTNTPNAELAVYDANDNDDSWLRFRTTTPAKDMVVGLSSGDAGMVSVESGHPLVLRTSATEQLRITADGKVGMPTPVSTAKLAVQGGVGFGALDLDGDLTLSGNAYLLDGLVGIGTIGTIAQLTVLSNSTYSTIYAENGGTGLSLKVAGDAEITGNLSKGSGSFKIDHPLDPENKYLYHSFVESPDMKNVYDGTVRLDAAGKAVVELPAYFEALNRDFRYQLTAIGAPGPNLYISREVEGNTFEIAGGDPGMEVSWMVTGIRQDPFAVQHPIQVEVDKPAAERGTYLHPEAYAAMR